MYQYLPPAVAMREIRGKLLPYLGIEPVLVDLPGNRAERDEKIKKAKGALPASGRPSCL